jgi:hypothetical protein
MLLASESRTAGLIEKLIQPQVRKYLQSHLMGFHGTTIVTSTNDRVDDHITIQSCLDPGYIYPTVFNRLA